MRSSKRARSGQTDQRIVKAQADLKQEDGNGRPIFDQMSEEAFGLTRDFGRISD